MKKTTAIILTAAFLLTAFVTTSCGKTEKDAESDSPVTTLQTEDPGTETDDVGQTTEPQSTEPPAGTDTREADERLTESSGEEIGVDREAEEIFGLFAGEYSFSAGVGFWATTMRLNGDGTFEGKFNDWDSTSGDDFEGINYCSVFSGSFKNPEKINDYTYSFEIDHIDYEHEPGTEEIVTSEPSPGEVVRTKMKYSEAYGLDHGTTTVYAYTAGAPVAELPESFINWVGRTSTVTKEDDELPFKGLYAVEPGYGWSGPQ